ncbi:cation acetate symporter [Kitasatospora sp. NPDC048365]|uniref:sodium:solute symporter family transporter n=1 Tax=Kitasatospora sp. NPDC048365 TaxID=3364050 RepID=UPI00371D2F9F
MTDTLLLADGGSALVTPLTSFLVVICIGFLLCLAAGMGNETVADYYAAERSLSATRNALALCGDFIPATALLTPIGSVALSGYDGMATTVSASVATVVLLALAQPLRNTGRLTLGSVLAARTAGRAARIAGAVVTVAVCLPLTVVQLVVAGDAIAYVVGYRTPGAALVCTVLSGLLITTFAVFGGMRGTSTIQAGKALLVLGVVVAVAAVAASALHWDLAALLTRASADRGGTGSFLAPGLHFGTGTTGRLDQFSLCLTLSLGASVLPPLLMRVGASAHGRAARRAVRHATVLTTLYYGVVVLLGLAAGGIVGVDAITADDPRGNSALLLLTDALSPRAGSGFLFTAVACAVFVTSLASVAGLVLAGAAALSHDLYAGTARVRAPRELPVAQGAVVLLGLLGILTAVLLRGWSILFLAAFATAVAASAILPALVYALFWPGFSRTGMLWTLYGSLACCLLLQTFSPTVSGQPYSLLPGTDFHWFPLQNIALVTVPAGFLLGWAGSRLRPPTPTERTAAARTETAVLTAVD